MENKLQTIVLYECFIGNLSNFEDPIITICVKVAEKLIFLSNLLNSFVKKRRR